MLLMMSIGLWLSAHSVWPPKECKEHNRSYSKQSSGSFLLVDLRTTWQPPPLLNLELSYEVSITHTLTRRFLEYIYSALPAFREC
jgi:hypothetical protein